MSFGFVSFVDFVVTFWVLSCGWFVLVVLLGIVCLCFNLFLALKCEFVVFDVRVVVLRDCCGFVWVALLLFAS